MSAFLSLLFQYEPNARKRTEIWNRHGAYCGHCMWVYDHVLIYSLWMHPTLLSLEASNTSLVFPTTPRGNFIPPRQHAICGNEKIIMLQSMGPGHAKQNFGWNAAIYDTVACLHTSIVYPRSFINPIGLPWGQFLNWMEPRSHEPWRLLMVHEIVAHENWLENGCIFFVSFSNCSCITHSTMSACYISSLYAPFFGQSPLSYTHNPMVQDHLTHHSPDYVIYIVAVWALSTRTWPRSPLW
jgi:hypothetical protein